MSTVARNLDADIGAAAGGFQPRACVATPVGKLSIMLYPVIDETMKIEERAHAFHVNKSALHLSRLPAHSYLDALGNQLGTTTTIEGKKYDFQHHFDDQWSDPSKFVVVTFHNSAGAIMNNATVAANPRVLKPVADGPINDCRPADVRFVRVSATIDFADLITIPNPGNTFLRVSYYIELPQSIVPVLNAAPVPVARNLETFHGVDDLSTLTKAAFHTAVIDHIDFQCPIGLSSPAWNVNDATIDSVEIRQDIERKYLSLALGTIEQVVFEELCPGYTNKPHAAVESIYQITTDSEGNRTTTPFHQYYKRIMQASRSFAHDSSWPVSVCNVCIDHMDPRLRSAFEEIYPRHNEPHDRDGRHQRTQLQEILQKATIAEGKIRTIQNIAWTATGAQGFCTAVGSAAYPSQAETTLATYDPSPTKSLGKGKRPICWGCEGSHVWCTRNRIVTCPNKDKPGVKSRAEKTIAARVKAAADRKANRDKSSPKRKFNYDELAQDDQQRLLRQALASQADEGTMISSITSSTGGTNGRSGPQIFILNAVFSTLTVNSRPVLPVPIQSNFPHMNLQLGTDLDNADCPRISVVIDTAASLTTGRSAFFFELARKFPHCVAAVYTAKTYAPITLSGIIRSGDNAPITSELPVGFAFHMPYKTKDGEPTQFIVACGPDVAVNCILGLPFMKATKLIFDSSDHVVDCKLLDCPPFPVEYKRAVASVPTLDRAPSSVNFSTYKSFIDQLNVLETTIASVCAATVAPLSEPPHSGNEKIHGTAAMPPLHPVGSVPKPVGLPPHFPGLSSKPLEENDVPLVPTMTIHTVMPLQTTSECFL